MNKLLTTISALSILLATQMASAATLTGPIGDAQLVRGFKVGVSVNLYPNEGPGYTAEIKYGWNGAAPSASVALAQTGYGNRVGFFDAPADAATLHYVIYGYDANGNIVYSETDNGGPITRGVNERAVAMEVRDNGDATVKYAGRVTTTYDTFLHVGWNNWNDVGDVFMQRSEFSYSKAGVYYNYNYATVNLPWWSDHIDFVFKDQRGGGTWDNNNGRDWHYSVHPFVEVSAYGAGAERRVQVKYVGGGLSPVILHYGVNGWQSPTDIALSNYGGSWTSTISAPGATALDFVFHNGAGSWQNNFGFDWHVKLGATGAYDCGDVYCPPTQ